MRSLRKLPRAEEQRGLEGASVSLGLLPFLLLAGSLAAGCVTRQTRPPIYRGPARATSLDCVRRVLEGAGYRLGAPQNDTTAVVGEARRPGPDGERRVHVVAARLTDSEDGPRLEVIPRSFLEEGGGDGETGPSRPPPEEVRTAAAYVAAACTRDELPGDFGAQRSQHQPEFRPR